jgi:hypothetical protein
MAAPAKAGPEFLQYEGRNAIHDGQGGERKTVEGIDFWMNGDPPRRYQVLGSLTDRRHETGLFGAIRMSTLDSDIAKAARAAGGDAVVLAGEDSEVVGVTGSTFGTVNGAYGSGFYSGSHSSFGVARAMKAHDSRYIVIKSLPDATPSPPPVAAATPSIPGDGPR